MDHDIGHAHKQAIYPPQNYDRFHFRSYQDIATLDSSVARQARRRGSPRNE